MGRRGLGVLATAIVVLLAVPSTAGANPQIGVTGSDGRPLQAVLAGAALLPGDDASGVATITNTGSSPGDLQITASSLLDTSGGELAGLLHLQFTVGDHTVWAGPARNLLTTTVILGALGESQSAEVRVTEALPTSVRDRALEGAGVNIVLTFSLIDGGGSTSQVTAPLTGPPTEVAGRSFNRGGGFTAFTGIDAATLVWVAIGCVLVGAVLRYDSERRRRRSRIHGC